MIRTSLAVHCSSTVGLGLDLETWNPGFDLAPLSLGHGLETLILESKLGKQYNKIYISVKNTQQSMQ